jgi:prepilin-type N-terminal cleavage/methylation domain-containing protein
MKTVNSKGFTLIEVIVVSVVIAILAAILVPTIMGQIDESQIAKAKGEVKSIQTALVKFKADTKAWPNRTLGTDPTTATVTVLYTGGEAGKAKLTSPNDWPVADAAVAKELFGYMGGGNSRGYDSKLWKGPYLPEQSADPWGAAYLVGAKNFEDPGNLGLPVWILSAGPDGIIQTPIDSQTCHDGKTALADGSGVIPPGDDICLRFK